MEEAALRGYSIFYLYVILDVFFAAFSEFLFFLKPIYYQNAHGPDN